MARRILYQTNDLNSGIGLTVTEPGNKSDIVVTIETHSGATMDIQTIQARKIYDALGKALGE